MTIVERDNQGKIVAVDNSDKIGNSNVGRPTKIDKDVIQKLENAFTIGSSIAEACASAKISESAFYNFTQKHPEYRQHFADLRMNPVLKARITVYQSLDNPIIAQRLIERQEEKEERQAERRVGDVVDLHSGSTIRDVYRILKIKPYRHDENGKYQANSGVPTEESIRDLGEAAKDSVRIAKSIARQATV